MSSRPMHMFQGQPIPYAGLELLPNAPNPFIEMTLLWFNLPANTSVTLRVYDALGREVYTRTSTFEKGENHIILRRSDLQEPGMYSYQLESEFGIANRKLMMY
ncbi:MAG: T9SS type A sorting domain-containing protein [Thermoanaerobaculia bacterium]|nr:T9SS type A sorting domain-containing protein [Thermoanaerobaculia bacterium]